jgi:hypothetical protein
MARKKSKYENAPSERKAERLLKRAFGDRAKRLGWGTPGLVAMAAIETAFKRDLGLKDAHELAFHMSDWGRDAAKLLLLHLYPEKFSKLEIDEIVRGFVIHVPNHLAAACAVLNTPAQDVWGIIAKRGTAKKTRKKGSAK